MISHLRATWDMRSVTSRGVQQKVSIDKARTVGALERKIDHAGSAANAGNALRLVLSGLFEVVPQKMGRIGPAQLRQGLGFDLTHPLPRHAELPADLFEGADLPVVESEAQTNHVLLSLGQVSERLSHRSIQKRTRRRVV